MCWMSGSHSSELHAQWCTLCVVVHHVIPTPLHKFPTTKPMRKSFAWSCVMAPCPASWPMNIVCCQKSPSKIAPSMCTAVEWPSPTTQYTAEANKALRLAKSLK